MHFHILVLIQNEKKKWYNAEEYKEEIKIILNSHCLEITSVKICISSGL